MEYVIKNECLKAVISSHGAELRSLVDNDNLNRMNIPMPNTWNKVSPILFPQISKLPNSEYQVNGKKYYMTSHGFLRDNELELVYHYENEIRFRFSDNLQTKTIYPYHFIFFVTYRLVSNNLEVIFEVQNPFDGKIRFMLGAHPGFRIPLYEDEKFTDYYLEFEKKETAKRMVLKEGYLSNEYVCYLNQKKTIPLNHTLFLEDAIILRDLKSSYVDICSKNHQKKIRFYFSDFEILALWSKPNDDCNFLCLEPWNGIRKAMVIEHEKMGVLELDANNSLVFEYKIMVI